MTPLSSARARYRPLAAADLDALHALVTDAHIRRYLMDGETVDRAWCADAITASAALFARRGVGLWLVFAAAGLELEVADPQAPIGLCGFHVFADIDPEPHLLYALLAPATGRGLATEIARALVAYARDVAGFAEIGAAVDEPNRASSRVLDKVGFRRAGACPGKFGATLLYRYPR